MLSDAEVGPDFSRADESAGDPTNPGQLADYTVTFLNFGLGSGGSLDLQFVVVGLDAYADAKAAGNGYRAAAQQLGAASGATVTLTPVPTGPKIGDESSSYSVTGSAEGVPVGGYAITWRRGSYTGAVLQFSLLAPKTVDAAAALARKQDDKLRTAGR
jgi:hypothetical protein